MNELPKKSFWTVISITGIIIAVVFISLIVKLFDRGHIIFTDVKTPDGPELFSTDPILGAVSPSVVVVYFGNFTCEGCADLSKNLQSIVDTYPNDVTIIWKDFPNTTLNSESSNAAIAARCAQEQNKFWEYHDMLMSHQSEIGNDLYIAISKELGLREGKYNRCIKNKRTEKFITASLDEVTTLNLTTAPTLFINNKRYTGNKSLPELETIIGDLIAGTK